MNSITSSDHLTWSRQLILSHLWFALNLLSAALLPIVIPTQILLFVAPGQVGNAEQVTLLAWLSAIGAIITLFVQPLIGLLSDRTPGPLGRRRPYIIIGATIVLFTAVPLIGANNIVILVVGLGLLMIGINVITAAYQGFIPDLVPYEQRGAASGYMGFMTILGNVGSLALAAWLFAQVNLNTTGTSLIRSGATTYYTFTIIILLIGSLITTLGVREKPLMQQSVSLARTKSELRSWLVQNWITPWHSRNFTVVFLTRFEMMMGLTLFMTFIEYYMADVAHVTNFVQATAAIAVLALLGAVCSALLLGILSDHTRRVPLVSLATGCMALAAFAFVVLPSSFPLWPLGILFGLGYGTYTSVDWALAVDALPSTDTAGKDLGIWNAASTLPTVIAPLLGGAIIILLEARSSTALGYRLVFATATFFLILAALGVLLVREQGKDDPPEDQGKNISAADQEYNNAAATDQEKRDASADQEHNNAASNDRGKRDASADQDKNNASNEQEKRKIGIGWKLAFQTHGGKARGFLRFWPFYERLNHFLWPLQPIPNAPYSMFQIRPMRYTDEDIDLPDGTHVSKGDPIIELHFRNQALVQIEEEQASAWRYIHLTRQSLSALAAWMQQPDFPSDARAIHGRTLLYRGAARLGFTLRERPKNLHNYLERFFMTGLLVLYNREGSARLLQGTTYGDYPQDVWMSRQELLRRYGKASAPAASPPTAKES